MLSGSIDVLFFRCEICIPNSWTAIGGTVKESVELTLSCQNCSRIGETSYSLQKLLLADLRIGSDMDRLRYGQKCSLKEIVEHSISQNADLLLVCNFAHCSP